MDLQHLRGSDGTGEAVLAHIMSPRTAGATVLDLDNVDNWNTKVIVVTGTPAANGFINPAGMKVMYGSIVAGDLNIAGFAPGYVDNGNTTQEVAIVKMTTHWADALVDILKQTLADNGKIKTGGIDADTMFSTPLNPLTRKMESQADYVFSGGDITTVSALTGAMANIVYYINGQRYTISSIPNKVYTASKDTYVDVNTSGAVVYSEVANGAASPALAANHKRLARVVTNGSAITRIQQVGFDTLWNRFHNTVAVSPTSQYCNVAGMPSLNPAADDRVISSRLSKPYDIMTVGGKQNFIYQPFLRTSGNGNISLYRISYFMRAGAAYTSPEPNSSTTAGSSANYQTLSSPQDYTIADYWADYDFISMPFQTTFRVEQKRDGAGGGDTNPGTTEMEGCFFYYNRDYRKV